MTTGPYKPKKCSYKESWGCYHDGGFVGNEYLDGTEDKAASLCQICNSAYAAGQASRDEEVERLREALFAIDNMYPQGDLPTAYEMGYKHMKKVARAALSKQPATQEAP